MKKERKFMSSKEIYFLPMINKIHSSQLRRSFDAEHSPSKLRSIEQIMHDKTMSEKQQHNVSLEILKRPKAQANENLYNKYELLPKIMSKKLKRKVKAIGQTDEKTVIEQPKKDTSTQNTKPIKQDPINFSSSFYQRQFKQLLAKEVSNLPFQLAPSYSDHNLLMAKNIEDEALVHLQDIQKKYTKVHITEPQEIERNHLGKVPEFLLRLLEPCRK